MDKKLVRVVYEMPIYANIIYISDNSGFATDTFFLLLPMLETPEKVEFYFGKDEKDGKRYRDSFVVLKENQEKFLPEWFGNQYDPPKSLYYWKDNGMLCTKDYESMVWSFWDDQTVIKIRMDVRHDLYDWDKFKRYTFPVDPEELAKHKDMIQEQYHSYGMKLYRAKIKYSEAPELGDPWAGK